MARYVIKEIANGVETKIYFYNDLLEVAKEIEINGYFNETDEPKNYSFYCELSIIDNLGNLIIKKFFK